MTQRLCLCVITGVRGLKGDVRLKPFTQEIEHLFRFGPLESEDGAARFSLYAVTTGKDEVIARIKGVDDRTAAERLKGLKLFIERARLPALESNEFYHADILGLRVVDEAGQALGEVKAVHDFGAGDILEIAGEKGASFMIAFTQETVPHIDMEARFITVRRPEEIDVGEEEGSSL